MGQAGLHIPAFDNSELSVFDSVYSDIGDEQSIEQNLSTFSGHITNAIRILSLVTEKSLVLFDELGAGTDPTEGAALAMSIISHLHDRRIRTAVTTHYPELKVFAIGTEGIENASCEFDVETLSPTYKLLIGIPGKSNAFAISKRLGMTDDIINRARDFISQESVRFEDVITELEITQKSVELEQKRALEYKAQAERLKEEVEAQKEKMRLQREKIIAAAKNEAYEITLKASAESDAIIKEMKSLLNDKQEMQKVESERRKLKEALSDTYDTAHVNRKKGVRPENVKEGDRVFILSFKQPGVALSSPNKNGDVKVMMGNMKVDININDLETDDNVYVEKEMHTAKSVKTGKSQNISPELDLRGQMVDEALENTTKYLDNAYLSGLKTVTIIHGKGTGALRNAVHKMLKTNAHVEEYRLGSFGEGEHGVTICSLRS
jgi:DNA mismatch repair protein MutS2